MIQRIKNFNIIIPIIGIHWVNGSPVCPEIHVQVGIWFWTLQFVFKPQDP